MVDLDVAREGVDAAKKALDDASEEESVIQMKLGGIRAAYDEVKDKLTSMEAKWAESQAELAELRDERASKMKEADAVKLDAKKVSLQLSRLEKDRGEAEKKIAGLEKKYNWVKDNAHAFGVPGGDYDFDASNLDAVFQELVALKKEQEVLVSWSSMFILLLTVKSFLTLVLLLDRTRR